MHLIISVFTPFIEKNLLFCLLVHTTKLCILPIFDYTLESVKNIFCSFKKCIDVHEKQSLITILHYLGPNIEINVFQNFFRRIYF